MGKRSSSDDPLSAVICRNRKALHEYDIIEQLQCGIVLQGSEVKSIRNRKVSLEDAFARLENGELWMFGCDIAEYPQANVMNHEPKRPRKLLIHRRELRKFAALADQNGLTLIPLQMHFERGFVKVVIALARGRKLHDKRERLKQKADRREMESAMKRPLRPHRD